MLKDHQGRYARWTDPTRTPKQRPTQAVAGWPAQNEYKDLFLVIVQPPYLRSLGKKPGKFSANEIHHETKPLHCHDKRR